MADNVNNNNGDIVNSRYPPKEYTAVPGQLLMPHLKKMKQAISDSKDFDPNFDIVAANKWLRDEKRMGNWKYIPPKKKRRRAVKSKKKAFSHKDRRLAQQAALRKRAEEKAARIKARKDELRSMVSVKQHVSCHWQYLDHKNGKTYYCTNAKEEHPLLLEEGARFCKYHMKLCVNDHTNRGNDNRKFQQIQAPNRHALCDDCWHEKLTGFPRKIHEFRIPGVYTVKEENYKRLANVQAATTASDASGGTDEEQEKPKCRFRKTNMSTMRRMFCTAEPIRHRVTKAQLFECGWHQKNCIAAHTGKPPKIEIPNELGVCVAHYISITGSKPSTIAFHWTQIPTVAYKRNELRIAPRKHSLAPRGMPAWKAAKIKERMERQQVRTDDDGSSNNLFEDETPLSEILMNQVKNLARYVYTMIPAPPVPVIKAKFFLKQQLFVYRLKKKYPKKALIIQRTYRGYLGRNRARLLRERAHRNKRDHSAVIIQRLVRKFLGSYYAKIYLSKRKLAAATINRVARGYLSRRRLRRKLRAIQIQKNIRGFLGRIKAGGKRILRGLEDDKIDRVWANKILWTACRRWLARRRRVYWYVPDTREEDAAFLLQRNIRGFLGRQKAKRQAIWIAKYHFAIQWFQRRTRGFIARKYFGSDVIPRLNATKLFQRVWRGQRDRREKVEPERLKLHNAWNWLKPTLPRKAFEQFMPRSAYDVQGGGRPAIIPADKLGGKSDSSTIKLIRYLTMCKDGVEGVEVVDKGSKLKNTDYSLATADQLKKKKKELKLAKRRWPKKYFLRYDPEASGVISKRQFREALHACGHYLSPDQVTALTQRFDPSQVGWVNYENFLTYVLAQTSPCTRHRAWGCALCVTHKSCLKCNCHKFKQEPSGGYLGYSEVCECGHYKTMHLLEPLPRMDKEYKEGEAYTKSQLKFMLEYEGDRFIPEGIKGSKLPDTIFETAYTYKDLKATLNNVDDRVAGRMEIEPMEKTTKADHTGSIAYIKLYKHVIGSIATTSENVLNDLNGDTGWNDCTEPRSTKTGFALPTEHGSGHLTSVGDVKAPAKLSKQAEAKLEEIAFQKAEVERELKSDPRSTSFGIRERVNAAKDEEQDLLPGVAANVSNLEIYETKFTLTRPLPFIGGKTLQMRTDMVDMFIEVLLAFSDRKLGLLENDQLFAQYVYNIFTFLDRHWKKIVSSLRLGTLHYELPIDKGRKEMVETHLEPMPKRSLWLDKKLKKLGFHRRASNSTFHNIEEKGDEDSDDEPRLDEISDDSNLVRPSTAGNIFPTVRDLAKDVGRAKTLLQLGVVKGFKDDSMIGLGVGGSMAMDGSSENMPRPYSVQLQRRGNMDAELLPDIGKQLNVLSINERFHDIATGPLKVKDDIIAVNRMTKPFVCTHPGCGKSFTDPRVARLHQESEHTNKPRLVSRAPDGDQSLNYFWPKDVPWRKFTKAQMRYSKSKGEVGKKYVSRITGKRFLQKKGLISHLRFQERYRSKLEDIEEDPNVKCLGGFIAVPPKKVPSNVSIKTCEKHYMPMPSRCDKCKMISNLEQPELPCEFYKHVSVSWDLTYVPFKIHNSGRLMMVKTILGPKTPISVSAICKDRLKRVWIAYSKFWTFKNLKKVGHKVRTDFWKRYELLEETKVTWMQLTEITGTCFVLAMSRNEYQRQKQNRELPKVKYVFFCKERFAAKNIDMSLLYKKKKKEIVEINTKDDNNNDIISIDDDGDNNFNTNIKTT